MIPTDHYVPFFLCVLFSFAINMYTRHRSSVRRDMIRSIRRDESRNRFYFNERYKIGSWNKPPRRKRLQPTMYSESDNYEIWREELNG